MEETKVVGLSAAPLVRVARHRLPPIEPRIALNKVEFQLIPKKLPQPQIKETEKLDYQTASDIFRQVYKMIYKEFPSVGMSLGKEWEKVADNARQAGMDFQSFLACNIAGYKLTHPYTSFFKTVLTGPSSVTNVAEMKKLCLEKFNTVDVERMGLVLDIALNNIDDEMLASEVAFGSWIVGQKLMVGGNSAPGFYERKEYGLSVFWLAIEPTYYDLVLDPFQDEHFGSVAEQKHRHNVLQTIARLTRRPTLASTVFNSRRRIMHSAVKHVLRLHGLTEESFTYPDKPVHECYPFWNGLGLALLHYETLKAVLGERHRLWH